MGYGYEFRLATEESLDDSVIEEIKTVYQPLTSRDWFPRFGEPDSSGSRGYGVGEQGDKPLSELFLLTSHFPDITFVVFLFYWDHMNLTTYKIQGEELIECLEFNTDENFKFSGISMSIYMRQVSIENDISELLYS